MRTATTAYFTALSVAFSVYLIFVLLLSFENYPNIHDSKYELYWRFYGIINWFTHASSMYTGQFKMSVEKFGW